VGTLARIESGSGPAVLLIHGLNGFKEGWGPLPRDLAGAGMRPVIVDLPGFGASPRVRGRTTPERLARSLDPLIAELAPVALVAHSLGAQIAVLAAASHRQSVRSLALISPWVIPRRMRIPPRSVSDVLQIPLLGRLLARVAIARIRRSPERRRDAFLTAVADPAALNRDPEMAALLATASDRLESADLRAMAGWAAGALALDLRPAAAALTTPALVVCGTADRITRPDGAAWLARAMPAGTLLSVPGAGHFPHLERRELVVPAILAHLA
jgi:pimeloyl-ACP methyl ester carboxylesterase